MPTPGPRQPRRALDFALDFAYSFPQIKTRRFATKGLIVNSSKPVVRLALRDIADHFTLTFENTHPRHLLLTLMAGPAGLTVHP